jgi:methionyl-tRNA formyltransferase
MKPRTVFMGSPEFALPTLRMLFREVPLVGVVTQPDRPAGRGKVLTPPSVKRLAEEMGVPFIQPPRLRQPEALQQLKDWDPGLIVVAAFGQILRAEVLELPRYGCINVHGSLLPRWRGAAPVQAAILEGDSETGITIMRMDPGVDTGPMLSKGATPILPDDTAGTLSLRLAELGAELLAETLPGYLEGTLQPQAQNEALATYAPMLKKEAGRLSFESSAVRLVRLVRAYNPWPGAFMLYREQVLKIHRAHAVDGEAQPGRRLVQEGLPAVGCAGGLLVVDEVQPAGKKAMPGKVFLQGAREWST